MERRWNRSLVALLTLATLAVAGCGSSSSSDSADPTAAASIPDDPAARIAYEFLEAVVKGDTSQASQLLTPLAVERINASGKPFQLPGLANYTFRVGQVRRPAEDKAFVQCMGTDRSTTGKAVEEEFCWLMSLVDGQWRVAGISYSAGPRQTLMIYSFEEPEKGAVPVEQLMARAAKAGTGRPSPQSAPSTTSVPPTSPQMQSSQPPATSPPQSAQGEGAIPTAAYR